MVIEQPVQPLVGLGLALMGVPAYVWWRRADSRQPIVETGA